MDYILFMDWNIICVASTIIGIQVLILTTGIILGRFMCIYNTSLTQESLSSSRPFISKKSKEKNIDIDETKVVGHIQTNNLEKKFSSLTNETEIATDLGSSISKLKNMKG